MEYAEPVTHQKGRGDLSDKEVNSKINHNLLVSGLVPEFLKWIGHAFERRGWPKFSKYWNKLQGVKKGNCLILAFLKARCWSQCKPPSELNSLGFELLHFLHCCRDIVENRTIRDVIFLDKLQIHE